MEVNYKALGKKVKEERRRHGLTQEKLAERISVSIKHIGSIERAESIPSIQVLVALANELEVTTDYLLCDSITREASVYETEILSLIQNKSERYLRHIMSYIKMLNEEHLDQ